MSQNQTNQNQKDSPSPFIDGYFTSRVVSGERPDYGYPTNHLPEPTFESMQVVTSFMASRKNK